MRLTPAEQQAVRTLRCRQKKRDFLNWLKEAPCQECGRQYPAECMDFDHRPGTTKTLSLSYGVNYEWRRVVAEIRKCDLVCANCHRIRTTRRIKTARRRAA